MLAGRVVLVDRGGQYVVSEQYRDEGTNELQDGWGQGNYFPHVGRASHLPPQEEALAAALVKYTEMVQRRKSMAQAA